MYFTAVWLQLQWVKPWDFGLLTIHPLRLASGGGSPHYHSVCSCNAAVLRAEEWEVWWCVTEVQEVRGGNSKEDRGSGKWMGKKEHVEIIVNTKHLLRWTMNSLDLKSRFTRAFCQLNGKILYCRGRSSHSSLSIPAMYGTICQDKTLDFFVSLVTEHDILPKFSQEPVLMFSGCIGINWHWKLAIINPTTTFTVMMKTPKSGPSTFKFTYSHKWFKSFATQWEGGEKKITLTHVWTKNPPLCTNWKEIQPMYNIYKNILCRRVNTLIVQQACIPHVVISCTTPQARYFYSAK